MDHRFGSEQFYGRVLNDREVAGFRLVERVYGPDFRTRQHSHQEAYFCFVIQGTSKQTYGRKERLRGPSSIIFYPPGELQSERFDGSGGRIFSVEIQPRVSSVFERWQATVPESFHLLGESTARLVRDLYNEFCQTDMAASMIIEGLILELLGKTCRQSLRRTERRPPGWLAQARELLHAQFSQNLTITEVADLVGVHRVYLASLFRKYYGCTAGDYLRRLRIEYARRELAVTDAPLVDIALAAGFCNQAHFSRVFKRLVGMTPTEYRASSRTT